MIPFLLQSDAQSLVNWLTTEAAPDEGTLDFVVIIARLSCAAVVGWVLGLGYRISFTGKKLNPTMHHTLIMLCLGGALVWLVVGDSIVRAFGLAGTIGLIRYRTTLRDPKDTTVLFFSMVLGMAIGLGHYATAIIGCLFVFSTLCLMRVTHTPPPPKVKKLPAPAPELPGDAAVNAGSNPVESPPAVASLSEAAPPSVDASVPLAPPAEIPPAVPEPTDDTLAP